MSRLLSVLCAFVLTAVTLSAGAQQSTRYGLGRAPTPQEVAAWDIDVRPDGHGLKAGKGTVAQGQKIYDAQCASCHGTFGESNRYMPIAGGVRKGDLETGRASMLLQSDGMRTLGTKLNYATTLWDYIFRAMPWANPQSLSVDETYAVTAYVLHLNEIVPADYELNEKTLPSVKMPNRNGFTTAHGLGKVQGRPDAQGSLCMKDCVKAVTIASEMPEFARNQNGNLAHQKRPLGPMRGIDTARYETAKTATAVAATTTPAAVSPLNLVARHACTGCHGMTDKIIGPGFNEIATKYQGRSDAQTYLAKRIKEGGQGVWGAIPMPPQPGVKDSEADEIARWIADGAK
ncbi:MAG: c-type cytochrome [Burkholderiaceae bacterium]